MYLAIQRILEWFIKQTVIAYFGFNLGYYLSFSASTPEQISVDLFICVFMAAVVFCLSLGNSGGEKKQYHLGTAAVFACLGLVSGFETLRPLVR